MFWKSHSFNHSVIQLLSHLLIQSLAGTTQLTALTHEKMLFKILKKFHRLLLIFFKLKKHYFKLYLQNFSKQRFYYQFSAFLLINVFKFPRQYLKLRISEPPQIGALPVPANFNKTLNGLNLQKSWKLYHMRLSTDWITLRVHDVEKNLAPFIFIVTTSILVSKWRHEWVFNQYSVFNVCCHFKPMYNLVWINFEHDLQCSGCQLSGVTIQI